MQSPDHSSLPASAVAAVAGNEAKKDVIVGVASLSVGAEEQSKDDAGTVNVPDPKVSKRKQYRRGKSSTAAARIVPPRQEQYRRGKSRAARAAKKTAKTGTAPKDPAKLGKTSLPPGASAIKLTLGSKEVEQHLGFIFMPTKEEIEVFDPGESVKWIESNWGVKVDKILKGSDFDIRPKIKQTAEEKEEAAKPLKNPPGYQTVPYDSNLVNNLETPAVQGNNAPFMWANSDWDFQNPLDWGKKMLQSFELLSEMTVDQFDKVIVLLKSAVKERQETKGGLKTGELLQKDLLYVIELLRKKLPDEDDEDEDEDE